MERLNMTNGNEEETEKASHVRSKRFPVIAAAAVPAMAALLCAAGWVVNNSAANPFRSHDEGEPESVQNDAMETAASALAGIAAGAVQPPGEAEYAAPHKITEPVRLSDIYAVSGSTVQMQCYYPEAESYAWEVFNRHTGTWEPVEGVTQQDELYRPVSALCVTAEGTDTIPVRCTVHMEDGGTVTEKASVYMIPEILDVSVEEAYVTDAGRYISSREIPVRVSYSNGTRDVITGLDGLTFVDSTERREVSASKTGNPVETVTTVYTECGYAYIGLEEKEFLLRYRCGEQMADTMATVCGKDLCAPVISDVSVSGFEITNVDTPVTASISITAEDDKTPYPDLEYAFIPKDTDADGDAMPVPDDTDWTRESVFSLDITQNGTWTAFCRDQGGNLASVEKEIIVVDQKAPVMSVRLADTEWCSSTKLTVDAEDHLPVEYRVVTPAGTDSGWTTQNEYEVSCNGTWEIQARDSVGNVSMESITVSNIDRQEPVIEKITAEKTAPTEGGSNSNED